MPQPLRALIVEDSSDDIELLLLELKRGGYEVKHHSVDTPQAMQEALQEEEWDVVLCDHAMPHFSSDLALRMVREIDLDLPFIIVSGAIGEEHAVNAMRAGCHDYVMKNNLARLNPAIERELRDAQSRRERRKAEKALLESEARLRQVVESLSVVFFSFEAGTNRCLFIMGAVQQLFGVDRAAFLSNTGIHSEIVHPDDANMVFEAFREGLKSREPFDLECRVIHRQRHEEVWIYQRVVPIWDREGKLIRHDSVVLDITPQKEAEEERRQLQAQLLHSQKLESIGVLAGGIAHDFNNLLTIISGNAQYLLQTLQLTSDQQRILKDIDAATRHAAEMTRSLQAFSRPSKPQIKQVDANRLIEEVHRLLRRTNPTTIDFQLNLQESLKQIAVDPGQMQQVLINLCVNSRDAMPSGGVLTIETSEIPEAKLPATIPPANRVRPHVCIQIKDTGMGMDQRTIEQVFDPFFTTKPMDRGTGLGLTIVYQIVQAHEGVIKVTSDPGKGTTFSLYFPAVDTGAATPEATPELRHPKGQEHVLVVENEEMVASLLKTVLDSRGYTVTLANTTDQAVELYQSASPKFGLVIASYNLPNTTGEACLKKLADINPELKSILVTGYDISEEDLSITNCGILHKPFSVHAIGKLVRDTLDADDDGPAAD